MARTKRTRRAAALTTLALAALIACPGTSAWAADDDDKDKGGQEFMMGIFGSLGIKRDENIDYRERSPLVVPPTRDLPPPVDPAAKSSAWPAGLGVTQPNEIAARRAAAGAKPAPVVSSAQNDSYGHTPMVAEPSDLGKLFSGGLKGVFSGGLEDEVGTFKAEPPRTSLTEPPPGYQTPSSAAPYGITKPGEFDKIHKLEEPPEPKL